MRATEVLLLVVVTAMTVGLIVVSHWSSGVIIIPGLSPAINKQLAYQSITLLGTGLFLLLLWRVKRTPFLTYFGRGRISAGILPEPWVGINPKPGETWWHYGRNLAIIITGVTALVMYFQVVHGQVFPWERCLALLPFSLVFALTNSFVEEAITRLGLVVVLKDVLTDKAIPLVSALLFGMVHYWGHPGGLIGVVVAGFLGWLLAKSILETRGIFWAWLIHFLQDVIIFWAALHGISACCRVRGKVR